MVRQSQSNYCAIVVAAGKGSRAGGPVPKQFAPWRGRAVVRHSVETFLADGADEVIIVIGAGQDALLQSALAGLDGWRAVIGGATRQASVRYGLEAVRGAGTVLVHDAARPCLPVAVIERLLIALSDADGAIPVLPVVDSLTTALAGRMASSVNREMLRRVQTPQAFRIEALRDAQRQWAGPLTASDEAQVMHAAGYDVALVAGDERLHKLTFAEDLMDHDLPMRVGTGFDVHRLVAGEELWLCGVLIPHDRGLSGHSDADVALHAVVDALLGAIGAGDIGTHFPPSDPKWRGAASGAFVRHAARLVSEAGYRIGNVDLTVICEAPRLGPHRDAMRAELAGLLSIETTAVSVKATTSERLGFTGRGEGIAAQAAVLLAKGA